MATRSQEQIEKGLAKLLTAGNRVIWWADPDQEFTELLPELALPGAELLSLANTSALAIKRRVELAEPKRAFVLYEPQDKPAPEDDWLLDMRLYAAPFAADATSMLQQDLGLRHAILRSHLKKRAAFFGSKERFKRLAELVHPDDVENHLDAKMWAVLTKSASIDPFMLWIDVLSDIARVADGTAYDQAPVWQSLMKFGLEDFVWASAGFHFGYTEPQPTLQHFIPRLFITDLNHRTRGDLPKSLHNLFLPPSRASNVAVLLSAWRDSSARQADYDLLSARLAAELELPTHLASLTTASVANCDTFVDLERVVATALRNELLDNRSESVLSDVRRVVTSRFNGYWVSDRIPDTEVGKRSIWRGYYQALLSATDLFEGIEIHARHFSYANASLAYDAYTQSLFKIDQHYRLFHEAADIVSGRFAEAIAPLSEQVESAYINSYVKKLARHWDGHVGNGLMNKWAIEGVDNQHKFYKTVVAPYVDGKPNRRMFVIISDALRYEVADELKTKINSQDRVSATLTSQLGVLPSYTKLGMASLLPHSELAYASDGLVKVDGRPSDGTQARSKILDSVNGLAVQAELLANMSQDAMRELLYPYRVIYIYHNKIDAIGDAAATESNTWLACRQAINELADLVSRLVNRVSATSIAITADHGFLYQESALEVVDKSSIDKPSGTIVHKKRYLVGKGLDGSDSAHHGSTAITAGTSCDTEFWLPRGIGRFHFTGGAQFVHGGASLQEVVVPIIHIRQKYKELANSTRTRKVGVNVLGQQHRITTSFFMFTLLQTDPVSEKVLAASIHVELFNQLGESVSTRVKMTLDSESADLGQRQTKVSVDVMGLAVKKQNEHFLVISDAETDVELQRIPVRIDLAIHNDFDF